ncbi:TetR/AcrR family transcriptional regulator [Sinomonas terrae]|uniref:TetR/AcrR family transcriptional regulator n=1 Tax=Sinomonas terrae TaxID=2908838 RepID=A0ABS9U4F8_9MICC|nr:TetR/AcrR family transcriptional regulator [Sinomonas terrae]MCH6471576.1 TetR/AcrR family transcriptional regulator [Sinomonas terrae]
MSPQKRQPSHGEGREALLEATVRVGARKGLRGLTFRAVAEEAGLNNSLIAHHFGTRDRLLAAALEWTADRAMAAADLSEYATDATAFREALVRNVLSQPDIEIFQFEMVMEATRRPELQDAVRELYRRYVAALAAGRVALGAEDDPGLNLAMFAALDGLTLQYFAKAITAEQLAEAVQALGVAVGSPSPSRS